MKTRTGTGSASSSSPANITFDFAPTFVYGMVVCYTQSNKYWCADIDSSASGFTRYKGLRVDHVTTSFTVIRWTSSASNNPDVYIKKSSDGKTIYWYLWGTASDNQGWIFNAADSEYVFLYK